MKFSSINAAIKAAGPGGTVMMLADKGAYNVTNSVTINSGGLAGAPVTVKGVSSTGAAMDITINGTRDTTWKVGDPMGNYVFKLLNGANNLVFDGFDFNNVQMGFQLGADLKNITIQNMEAKNVRYFIGNYASGTPTASVDGLTVKNVEVHGFSKSVILLKYDTKNVVLDNVFGDSQYQDGDKFAMGVMLDGTVHDVVIRNSTMKNCIATDATGSYWNGDGFVAERGVYNLRLENTYSSGHSDGGYDLKSRNTVLVNATAEDNKRNFRLWGDATLTDCVGIDPHKRGGSGSQAQVWIDNSANVKIIRGSFTDSGSSTYVFANDGGSMALSGVKVWHASGSNLKLGNVSGLDMALVKTVAATGTWSSTGEKMLTGSYSLGATANAGSNGAASTTTTTTSDAPKTLEGTSGDDVLAATGSGDWTINGGGGSDRITGGDGNDTLNGGGGKDTISAGAGDDAITGGGGADFLTGGAGADVFHFGALKDSSATARDVILDFQAGTDRLDLSALDANSKLSGDQGFQFLDSGAFTGRAGEVRVDYGDAGVTKVMADTNGDGVADFVVELSGQPHLTAGDLVL